MKDKPISSSIYSIIFLILAISIPLQVAYIYEYSFSDITVIFLKLNVINRVLIGVYFLCAFLVVRCSKAAQYLLPLAFILTAINNFFVSELGNDFSNIHTLSGSILFFFLCSTYFFTKSYAASLTPNLHWWKAAKRYQVEVPIVLLGQDDQRYCAKLFDISDSGAFIFNQKKSALDDKKFSKNKHVKVIIPFKNEFIKLKANVVRRTDRNGSYPGGFGLKFDELSIFEKCKLYYMVLCYKHSFY